MVMTEGTSLVAKGAMFYIGGRYCMMEKFYITFWKFCQARLKHVPRMAALPQLPLKKEERKRKETNSDASLEQYRLAIQKNTETIGKGLEISAFASLQ